MDYQFLTQDERDDALAQAIMGREREHHAYEVNALTCEAWVKAHEAGGKPTDLPDHLKGHAARTRDEIVAALPPDDASKVLAVKEYHRHRCQVKTERHEQAKVAQYHAHLSGQLTPERLAAARARLLAKEQAAKPRA